MAIVLTLQPHNGYNQQRTAVSFLEIPNKSISELINKGIITVTFMIGCKIFTFKKPEVWTSTHLKQLSGTRP